MNLKKLFKKLFGSKVQPDNIRVLVQILSSDNKEHYRWAPNPILLDKMSITSAWEDDDLSFLKDGIAQIDKVNIGEPEIRYELENSNHEMAEHSDADDELYCLYGTTDFFPHYVWSKTPLDVLTTEFKPVFKNDQEVVTEVASIKIIQESSTFCYLGSFFDLVRSDGKLKVVKTTKL